jgi:hypothetical protein
MDIVARQAGEIRVKINRVVVDGEFVLRSGPDPGNWLDQQALTIEEDSDDLEIAIPASGPRRFYQLFYAPPQ